MGRALDAAETERTSTAALPLSVDGRAADSCRVDPGPRSELDPEAGLSIVEIMVAMLILLVGVLGTFTMIDGSFASTRATTAREQGTNLARDLVERTRQVQYSSTTNAVAPTTLRATLPASDGATALAGSSFQVARRGITYTVDVFACTIDDPTDGIGVGAAGACIAPGVVTNTGSPPTGQVAVDANVLGIGVALGGSLLSTVCNVIGTNTSIANALSSAVSPIASLTACPSTSPGNRAFDSQPDDLRLVRFTVTWNQGGPRSLTQTTMLTNQT